MSLFLAIFTLFACVTAHEARRSTTRTDLGTAYLKEGNAPDAVGALRQAAALNPQNATAWERLGLAYMASNAHELSEDAFKRAIRLKSTDQPARTFHNYGLLLVKLGRFEEAIEAFDSTLSDLTYRTPAKALNSKGFTLYTMGKHDEAIEVLSKAIRAVPALCPARFHRGLAYQKIQMPEKALNDFEGVIQRCGNDATGAYYHAAVSLFVLGERDSGCTYLRTALRDSKVDAFAEEIRNLSAKECRR
jgi:type IV pilus biogenesis/stability protein PilW